MRKYLLQIMSLSILIFIGLVGSKGICNLDECQQKVHHVCIEEMTGRKDQCNNLVISLSKEQCEAFSNCLSKCPSFSSLGGCQGPEMIHCLRAQADMKKNCQKGCFEQNKVPAPSWLND